MIAIKKKYLKTSFYFTRVLPSVGAFFFFVFYTSNAAAQSYPSSIDPSRVESQQTIQPSAKPDETFSYIGTEDSSVNLQEQVEKIRLKLNNLILQGCSDNKCSDLEVLYYDLLGTEITVADIYQLAARITDFYRQKGYFLTRAFVPAQEIENGIVHIRIVEGYVAEVDLDSSLETYPLVAEMISDLVKQKPLSALGLESFILRLNDLGSQKFSALLQPLAGEVEGAVQLSLKEDKKQTQYRVSLDNSGSRYLGPYQIFTQAQAGLSPRHMGVLALGADVLFEEMKYAEMRHNLSVTPRLKTEVRVSHVKTEPGARLKSDDIRSSSSSLALGLSYQLTRQRFSNLSFSVTIDGRNSDGDFLVNNPLTRDRVRALRMGLEYDGADPWDGYNYLRTTLNKGIRVFGSSNSGDLNLSREAAKPDFLYFDFAYSRQQKLSSSIQLAGQLKGQISAHPLFSSEEFGFGGASLGKAYDPSEILGDSGLAGQVELRYTGFNAGINYGIVPYVYYDIGKVWNKDPNGRDISAASAGFGFRLQTQSGFAGELGLAFPLTKETESPLYGDKKSPRLLIQASYNF